MGARKTDMHRLQELVRLHRLGTSTRTIARQLRMGRDTIRASLNAFQKAGLLDDGPSDLPDLDVLRVLIEEHVPSKQAPQQTSSVERWRARIEKLLERGAGPTAIHDHLRLQVSDYDGSLSAVKRLCARLERARGPKATDVAIPVLTAPGEVAQVDFGYVGKIYDPERGVLRKAWLFVMALGFSRHMFCEIVFDQKADTWLWLHVHAFKYFGGVPKVIVPDNLKAAVVRAAFAVDDDPVIHRSYRELAQHFGFQIDPAPPREPKKKGKVERGVRYVKGNFFKAWESVDIQEDRRQLQRWNDEIAAKRRHGTTGRPPIELFEQEERAALIDLPKKRWELVLWKKVRLHTDSHVQIDGAFYSANWRCLHEELWAHCTPHSIVLYHGDRHLRTHSRVPRGQYSTFDDDLPEHRRDLRHRSHGFWIDRARLMGNEVEKLVEEVFGSDDVVSKLRCVQAIVTHLQSFPKRRARAAAKRALHFGCTDYASIKNILKKGLDLEPLPEETSREWSRDSQFARKPAEFDFAEHKE